MIWSLAFWKATAERVISTFAQAAIAALLSGAAGLFAVDWENVLSVAGIAALVSLFKCLVAVGIDPETGPSLTKAEELNTTDGP